jgi:hypothetical protein
MMLFTTVVTPETPLLSILPDPPLILLFATVVMPSLSSYHRVTPQLSLPAPPLIVNPWTAVGFAPWSSSAVSAPAAAVIVVTFDLPPEN